MHARTHTHSTDLSGSVTGMWLCDAVVDEISQLGSTYTQIWKILHLWLSGEADETQSRKEQWRLLIKKTGYETVRPLDPTYSNIKHSSDRTLTPYWGMLEAKWRRSSSYSNQAIRSDTQWGWSLNRKYMSLTSNLSLLQSRDDLQRKPRRMSNHKKNRRKSSKSTLPLNKKHFTSEFTFKTRGPSKAATVKPEPSSCDEMSSHH